MPSFQASVDVTNLMARMAAYEDQFPFAVASALTKTAKDAQQAVRQSMQKVFDRPTPYALNGTYVNPAKKTDPTPAAQLFFKNEASGGTPAVRFIAPEVYGGARNQKRYEMAMRAAGVLPSGMVTVPGDAGLLDRYGNLPAGLINAMLSQIGANRDAYQNATDSKRSRRTRKVRGQFFIGRPGGGRLPLGVWLRQGRSLKPFLLFVRQASYKVRLPFKEVVDSTFEQRFYPNFDQALARAIATAREK